MIAARSRWGPISGVLLCLSWAPMALAVPRLPALGSAAEVAAFWRANSGLMQATILSVGVGFLFLLDFLGSLGARVAAAPGVEAAGATAFGAALLFMTALNVAVGLDLAGGLLLNTAPWATYPLHAAGFLLAVPAAFAGVAFFVAVAAIAFRSTALPRWSGWLAVAGAVVDAGTVLGALSLTGPLNSGNGAVGGIAGPLGVFVAWVLGVSLSWLRQEAAPVRDGGGNPPRRSAPAR